GGRDARLIHDDVPTAQRLRLELVRRADRDLGAQSLEREEVGVHPPATDHVAPGRRQVHPPEPRQHRPREQNGRADPGGELGVELARLGRSGVHLDRVGRRPRDRRAQMGQQLEHGLDVADVGNVVDAAGPVGEQGGRQDGQRCVLVPRRADRPLQRAAARDAERRRHMVTASYGAACARVKRARTYALVNPILALGLLAVAWLLAWRVPSLAAVWAPRLPTVLGLAAVAAASGPGAVTAVARAVGVAPRLARALSRAAALETAAAALALSVPLALRHPVAWTVF